jgi:hypothetical protein
MMAFHVHDGIAIQQSNIKDPCTVALEESLGFSDDILEQDWELM